MATSYYNISFDHLADHLILLSLSSSFWFSLNSSCDNEFHLSKRLGIMPQDYEFLLVAADLAHFHKRWGFSIKMMKLKFFLEGHRFTTITMEVDEKKVDLNAFMKGEPPKHRERVYFIRIGVLHANSPRKIEMQKDSDGLMIVTPPRLNGLRIKQQSFRQCVEQSKWNYLLEKDNNHSDYLRSSISGIIYLTTMRMRATTPPSSSPLSSYPVARRAVAIVVVVVVIVAPSFCRRHRRRPSKSSSSSYPVAPSPPPSSSSSLSSPVAPSPSTSTSFVVIVHRPSP